MNYTEYDLETASEKRRQVRKSFEANISNPDKFQLNDLMLGALVIIAAIVSFTDFSLSWGNIRNFTALTIFLYIITMFVYRNRYAKGILRGKKETEYIDSLLLYRGERQQIYDLNIVGRVPKFCIWYKKKELREYRESLLCDIEMEYDEYVEKYLRMSSRDILKTDLSAFAKKTIIKCNKAKSIRLYPGMILNENGEYDRSKLIGKSGRERERSDKKKQAVTRAVYVVFGAMIAFDLIFNFSVLLIFQWIVRMFPVITAVISGEDGGYCNVAVTEVKFKNDQVHVIKLFREYANSQEGEYEA
jgi:hypothetical protein